jgi:hypothetical protein
MYGIRMYTINFVVLFKNNIVRINHFSYICYDELSYRMVREVALIGRAVGFYHEVAGSSPAFPSNKIYYDNNMETNYRL